MRQDPINSMTSINAIITQSLEAFTFYKRSTLEKRRSLLKALATSLEKQKDQVIEAIITEAFKPLTLAEIEVNRAISTLQIAAEEIEYLKDEIIDSNRFNQGKDFQPAILKYMPRGPILAIGPFNFPLNLLMHKIAPALASGSSVIVKPPHQAPTACRIFCEVFHEVRKTLDPKEDWLHPHTLQMVHLPNEELEPLVQDPRIPTISFTGSAKVGWELPIKVPQKKIILELGGNATVIVTEDADLNLAAKRLAFGSFAYAGQICISVQRILIAKKVYSQFKEKFIAETEQIKFGDLHDRKVIINQMIDSKAADKVEAWIATAEKKGSKHLISWKRDGIKISPVIMENVDHSLPLWCDEVFGPVVAIESYENFDDAIKTINKSDFGIHAGIFSANENLIQKAIDEIDTAGLIVNDIPTVRLDHLPYGGIKKSGLGREGPQYAMKEFSEIKVILKKKT